MSVERLELPDGQWADIATSPDHGAWLAIQEAAERAERGTGTWTRWAYEVGRRFTRAWYVRGEDGRALEFGDQGWAAAPPDIIDAICARAQEQSHAWVAKRRPLAPRATSSADTPPVAPST